jgi:hypothetical protein
LRPRLTLLVATVVPRYASHPQEVLTNRQQPEVYEDHHTALVKLVRVRLQPQPAEQRIRRVEDIICSDPTFKKCTSEAETTVPLRRHPPGNQSILLEPRSLSRHTIASSTGGLITIARKVKQKI